MNSIGSVGNGSSKVGQSLYDRELKRQKDEVLISITRDVIKTQGAKAQQDAADLTKIFYEKGRTGEISVDARGPEVLLKDDEIKFEGTKFICKVKQEKKGSCTLL